MKAVGYTRVSRDEQARSGLGLEAQAAVIRAEADRRGWELVEIISDEGYTGGTMRRPGITRALTMLSTGEAGALITQDHDRIARNVEKGQGVLNTAGREGWHLVVPGFLDTSTADGRMVAGLKLTIAQWERDKIAERTRAALAAKRARGHRFGRPVILDPVVRRRIARERAKGRTYQSIADRLNAERVPTATGKEWSRASVLKVCRSVALDAA